MNQADFKKAKIIESQIKDINHIISGLEKESFYKMILYSCGDNKTKELDEHLGRDFIVKINQEVVDALLIKRLTLNDEFSRYVKT